MAAWGQMLNYIVTIGISAFFVAHYFGGAVGIPALRHSPADIVFTIGLIALLALVNVRGVKESAGLNVGLAVTDFMTQLMMVVAGLFLVFSPETLKSNVHLGIGKKSFTDDQIRSNLYAFVDALNRVKPSGAKGVYLRTLTLASSMSPGIALDVPAIVAASASAA